METKQIYFRDQNYNYHLVEYKELSEIAEKFNEYAIVRGPTAKIGNRAKIGYAAKIGDDANIGNAANIGDDAKIGNGIILLTGFYINGTVHSVTYCGNGMLSIGCHNRSISDWKEAYERIGKVENYNEAQIKEYYQYILMAEMFHDLNYKKETE